MKINEKILQNTIKRCQEKGIIIPTYEQMLNPEKVPDIIKQKLKNIGLWDLNPLNLFRITWKNEPKKFGGGYGKVNHLVIPPELSGCKANIVVLLGKYFPTGAHKVGATFGPLVEKLITGNFDPTSQKALWPSTGNYCRGGAFDGYLLGCKSIAVLPEEMSEERFNWLKSVGAEIVATPGCESNVKEIYDETKRIKQNRPEEVVVLNQFAEFGNPMWHYAVTGPSMLEVYNSLKTSKSNFSGIFLTQGSAGTLACGDYLKQQNQKIKIACGEALQCPTLLYNGYGGHRIEGIGDKHVPWVHNLKNMDMVIDIDDNHTIELLRLFNEKEGKKHLINKKINPELVNKLDLLGISSIANILGCIKFAKYYELTENDFVFTVATDSMELYNSRLIELKQKYGEYTENHAYASFEGLLNNIDISYCKELSYYDKKRMHNLKYFTWVEQQNKTAEELTQQWVDDNYFVSKYNEVSMWDEKIKEFNQKTKVLQNMG